MHMPGWERTDDASVRDGPFGGWHDRRYVPDDTMCHDFDDLHHCLTQPYARALACVHARARMPHSHARTRICPFARTPPFARMPLRARVLHDSSVLPA